VAWQSVVNQRSASKRKWRKAAAAKKRHHHQQRCGGNRKRKNNKSSAAASLQQKHQWRINNSASYRGGSGVKKYNRNPLNSKSAYKAA